MYTFTAVNTVMACTFLLQRLKTALGEKKVLLDQISDIADDLQEEDGEKPNGTKDVDSRYMYRCSFVVYHVYSTCTCSCMYMVFSPEVFRGQEVLNLMTFQHTEH